jgi:hypothetical protein
MSRKRLIHDTAWATATYLLDAIRNCIHESDRKAVHKLFYDAITTGIEGLDLMQAREDHHLLRKPGNN